MKKSTLEAMRNYLNGDTTIDLSALREEVNAEYDRVTAKARANAELYAEAKEAVMNVLSDVPQTAAQVYNAASAFLPEDFTVAKVQYALLHYWEDNVVKHENGKAPYTYTMKY